MISLVFTTIAKVKASYIEDALAQIQLVYPEVISEIVVVDNSMDENFHAGLKERFKHYGLLAKFIYNPQKIQMGENWNTAFQSVTCPWVIFHHDDDVLIPENVKKIKAHLNEDLGFVSFDYYVLKNSNDLKLVKRNSGLDGIIDNTPKYISTIFNTAKLKSIGGWEDRYGYYLDFIGMLKLHLKYNSLHLNFPIGKYRVHAENASSRPKRIRGYGDNLHNTIYDIYPLLPDDEAKRKFIFHIASYAFPHQKLHHRAISKILSFFGLKVWIE
jgi:hypothetical protein